MKQTIINVKLVTCELCQNYYVDPRQISCSHSFCYDCLLGRFDEQTLSLICPKCNKHHQYCTYVDFENRCMRDEFLATMVSQYKKNQNRLLTNQSKISSHSSSITPQPINDQSSSERSTPSQQSIIAKCRLCYNRKELIICQHCDIVICTECTNEHQQQINQDVKYQWSLCETKFENLHARSIQYDENEQQMNRKARQLQTYINQLSNQFIQTIENSKNTYLNLIGKHLQISKPIYFHEQILDEYESINKRLDNLFKSNDITENRIEEFLFEIEHFEDRLDNFNKLIDNNSIKFPELTRTRDFDISSLFGTLQFIDINSNSSSIINNNIHYSNQIESIENIPTKKLLWQIDYFSVPYYIRIYDNHLYICDKYGSLAIYKLNLSSKPTLIEEIKLFQDNSTSTINDDDDQTFIDSFSVYKYWIIIFKRKKQELHGIVYLFNHHGKLLSNGKYLHNYPSRELTIDNERNILWLLDQKQLALFYYILPEKKLKNFEEYFHNRQLHVQFIKPFSPIHISVNQTSIGVLDKYRQIVHVYDKTNRKQIDEYVNIYYHSTHTCWDMALFSDNCLLIKLDEINTLKTEPSKHIYLQLDNSNEHRIIAKIEEINAYGMIITPNDEILIGIRVNTKGIIKCYI